MTFDLSGKAALVTGAGQALVVDGGAGLAERPVFMSRR